MEIELEWCGAAMDLFEANGTSYKSAPTNLYRICFVRRSATAPQFLSIYWFLFFISEKCERNLRSSWKKYKITLISQTTNMFLGNKEQPICMHSQCNDKQIFAIENKVFYGYENKICLRCQLLLSWNFI